MSLAKLCFKVKLYKGPRKCIGCRKIVYSVVARKVRQFYEQDDMSTQSPGKKDYITRKNSKTKEVGTYAILCNTFTKIL